jgi:hypothetical protein
MGLSVAMGYSRIGSKDVFTGKSPIFWGENPMVSGCDFQTHQSSDIWVWFPHGKDHMFQSFFPWYQSIHPRFFPKKNCSDSCLTRANVDHHLKLPLELI